MSRCLRPAIVDKMELLSFSVLVRRQVLEILKVDMLLVVLILVDLNTFHLVLRSQVLLELPKLKVVSLELESILDDKSLAEIKLVNDLFSVCGMHPFDKFRSFFDHL